MEPNKDGKLPAQSKNLRLWPGIVIVILQWAFRFVIPAFMPDATMFGVFADLLGGAAILLWWAFFSRAKIFDRISAILLIVASLYITSKITDISIRTAMMGLMLIVYSIPVVCLAFVVWAAITMRFPLFYKRLTMFATILLASGIWALLRTNGMDGEAHQDIVWRWSKTPEEQLLIRTGNKINLIPSESKLHGNVAEWPGFRGPYRDGIVHGVSIKTDWHKSPPVKMWSRYIGPGCSSFAVQDNLIFTQEQRGKYEMVICYNIFSGNPLWVHSDTVRFWDSHAGAGPRSTPTLNNGRVYTLGGTGILNVLEANNGNLIWSSNAAHYLNVKLPGWGYTGSPLVVDSLVIVALSGKLAAYDLVTGRIRWSSPDDSGSYSSPHLISTDGIRQILFMNYSGAHSFSPENGKQLWQLPLNSYQIIQPAVISESDILISTGEFSGLQRITVKNSSSGWTAKECWKSNLLRPNFNDLVIHKNYIYGFDGSSLACIDLENGERKWKEGRYGGQLILLADQDVILIISEKGDIVLVRASPEKFTELAKYPGIKGKTWNHPVLKGNILLVRNSEEMAAFRLPAEI